MDECDDLRQRFSDALRTCGHERTQFGHGLTVRMAGRADLHYQTAKASIELMQPGGDETAPYLYLADMKAADRAKGQGRVLLMQIFDLADAMKIQKITVSAVKIGLYFHAANFARCDEKQWDFLCMAIRANFDYYAETARTADVRQAREAQRPRVEQALQNVDGQLGLLVKALPQATMAEEKYPTLAQHLLLYSGFPSNYRAYWLPADRDMARTACGWVSPPLLPKREPSPLLSAPAPPSLRQRLKRALLG